MNTLTSHTEMFRNRFERGCNRVCLAGRAEVPSPLSSDRFRNIPDEDVAK